MQARLSLLLAAVGFALLLYMIIVEDEPGAIPLLLIAAGIAWFLVTRRRHRKERQRTA